MIAVKSIKNACTSVFDIELVTVGIGANEEILRIKKTEDKYFRTME